MVKNVDAIIVECGMRIDWRRKPLPASPKGRRAWRSEKAEREIMMVLRMAEGGEDQGDLGGEEGAAAKGGEVREGRIVEQQGLQFEPG